MSEETKDQLSNVTNRPWRPKPSARYELNSYELSFLFNVGKILEPFAASFELIENMKKTIIENGMVDYIDQIAKPQIEVIKKPEGKIVNIAGQEIKSDKENITETVSEPVD